MGSLVRLGVALVLVGLALAPSAAAVAPGQIVASGAVRRPAYALLTGGLRDGRRRRKAQVSRRPTGKFSSPQPSIVIEVGLPEGEGPYKLKTIYQYQEPGHRLVYSMTVPFSATVYGQ